MNDTVYVERTEPETRRRGMERGIAPTDDDQSIGHFSTAAPGGG